MFIRVINDDRRLTLWVATEIGGTFTDLIYYDSRTGRPEPLAKVQRWWDVDILRDGMASMLPRAPNSANASPRPVTRNPR